MELFSWETIASSAFFDATVGSTGRLLVIDEAAGIKAAPFDAIHPAPTSADTSVLSNVYYDLENEVRPWLSVSDTRTAAYAPGTKATAADSALTEQILGAVGIVTRVPEKLLDAVTGLSGSGPAYVYTIIEALSDGGVLEGLTKEQSILLAAQTLAGAAEMVLRTGLHPAVLRDQVTSPGGTTIAGLATLEEKGLRSALIECVRTATRRARELGKS